jgi:3-dehydroquinate synthase
VSANVGQSGAASTLAAVTVHVALGPRAYDVLVGAGQLARAAQTISAWLPPGARRALIVTDHHVRDRHLPAVTQSLTSAGFAHEVALLPPGEATKSLEQAAALYDRLIDMRADRGTAVVALGGGVIGDLAGFVAATFARGLPFVQIPTTLLAQVDSAVGGKVGVNHARAKNMIGAFYQPAGVLADTAVLQTLPEREFRAGLAEVVKYGVILDAAFFDELERRASEILRREPTALRDIVAKSCRLKADVVERDEFERTALRAVLNYGHTFAHAFETLLGYGTLLHGEAVAIGMVCASRLAQRLGRIDAAMTARQVALLEALGLPTRSAAVDRLDCAALLDCMRLDKKSVAGRLRFVLPDRMGHVELVEDVSIEQVRAVLLDR